MDTAEERAKRLGDTLGRARNMKRLSLKGAAGPAGISATYLQKLERGQVKEPSPHVLHGLSGVLGLQYDALMQAAGYVVPGQDEGRGARGALSHALSSEDLTDDESAALAEYLAFIRQQRGRG
jgi:HTH-type transcriptional regulator, competence development regulator